VRNPVAESVVSRVTPSPRPSRLDGKRIGLYWNLKSGGDLALEHVERELGARYQGVHFQQYHGSVGFFIRHCTPADADRISAEVDVLIGTTAD
jgi:hypothetical protein